MANLVVQAVLDESLRGRVLEICGPEAVSLSHLAEMVMAQRGWDGSPRRVPRPVLRMLAYTVGVARPAMGRQARAALAMDDVPTRHDDPLRKELPDLPRTAVSEVVAQL